MARGRGGLLHDHRSLGTLALDAFKWSVELLLGIAKRFPLFTLVFVVGLIFYALHDFISGDVGNLKIGDCFDLPTGPAATGGIFSEVQHHPCTVPHDAELIFVGLIATASDPFPTDERFGAFFERQCLPAYGDYTGRAYDLDPIYELRLFGPSENGWTNGQRAVYCVVDRVDRAPMTASVKVGR